MVAPKTQATDQRPYRRPVLSGFPHFMLAALFIASQFGFIYVLHTRNYALVYAVIAVTLGCLVNVYQHTKKDSSPSNLSSLVWRAVLQSFPLNAILYGVAYYKAHINEYLVQRQLFHSRATVAVHALLYGVVTLALITSASIRSGLPGWVISATETVAFLSLVGHIVVTTSDSEGLIDVLTMTAAALATFSIRLYWGQSFEVFHPPGAHGHYEGPVDQDVVE